MEPTQIQKGAFAAVNHSRGDAWHTGHESYVVVLKFRKRKVAEALCQYKGGRRLWLPLSRLSVAK